MDLTIGRTEVASNYNHMKASKYHPWYDTLRKLDRALFNVSDEKAIRFYQKVAQLKTQHRLYRKHQKLIDVLEFMAARDLVRRDIAKTYQFSTDDWVQYRNTDLGFEVLYRTKRWDGSDRQVVTQDNLVYLSGDDGIPDHFNGNLATLDTYTLSRRYPNAFVVEDNIATDADITTFLKKVYGASCGAFTKKATHQAGVFDIYLTNKTGMEQQDGCKYHGLDMTRYNANLQKMVTWHDDPGNICEFNNPLECLVVHRSAQLIAE